ncbi:ParH-like protein [Kitasatospora sp. NPDC056138]|uniref:ParH-like protein n=1 Tax=Kitasatospora sp. NPDC056138 TaxID=3345724 RepID=UPI0035E1F89E
MTGAERRRLWRRCRRLVRTLRLPEPFDLPGLAGVLTERLGRPVELLPLPAGSLGTCGMLVSTDRAEYIGYPTGTTALHQRHIVLHEVGHLLCGHHNTGGAPGLAGSAALGTLAPHLSAELVHRLLGRDVYSDTQEQEAELFATLAMHRVGGRVEPAGAGRTDAVVEQLGDLFGAPGGGPRPADA